MAFLIDEKTYINNNIGLHAERMESKYTRFLEKSPTYVTYYHIDGTDTTVDNGYQDVERVLGGNSPVRFNKINDFAIYMDSAINLQVELEDQGLDSSFEGEAIILPGTIDPTPNDYFIINHLGTNYAFMVTDFQYDTIKSNNYYRIGFSIKDTGGTTHTALEKQVSDDYQFILDNVGTQSRSLIQKQDIERLNVLEGIYQGMVSHYQHFFFNAKYNSFLLVQDDGSKWYDRYLTFFLNHHRLLNEKKNYMTTWLTVEDDSPTMYRQYDESLYRALEQQDLNLMKHNRVAPMNIRSLTSVFAIYGDSSVRSLDFNSELGREDYVPVTLIEAIQSDIEPTDPLEKLWFHYFKGTLTMELIPFDVLANYRGWIRYDFKSFLQVPVLLYILRQHYNFFMKQ